MIITEDSASYFKCSNFQRGVDSHPLSIHFNVSEFQSYYGSDYSPNIIVSKNLINKLEALYTRLNCTSMNINSGYRTSQHSVQVGGSDNDQHTKGNAADIACRGNNGPIDAKEVCCVAQDLGFTGIGYGRTYTHVDVRTSKPWWGDETQGNRNVNDFYQYFNIQGSTNPEPDSRPDREACENYVRTCFIEYLGRNADSQGLQSFTDMLVEGSSESAVDSSLLGSLEYKHNFIKACFRLLKGREASTSEISKYSSFGRLRDICNDILPDNTINTYVRTCYIEYLNRNVDANGINTFGNMLLNGSSESDVDNAIIGSLEYKQIFINDCYRIFLGRTAFSSEISYYSSFGRLRDICKDVYTRTVCENYVRTCFIEYLGRNADATGMQTYLNMLLEGASESAVDNGLLQSTEYKQIFIKDCFRILKGRTATSSEVSKYSSFGRLRDICNDIYPDNSVNNYVRTCYIEYLNRNVDASGLNNFANMLLNGKSEADVDNLILGCFEYKQNFINSCFTIIKGRVATNTEITNYSANPLLRSICYDVFMS